MKPCLRAAMPSSSFLQNIAPGSGFNKVAGSVKKVGQNYDSALIALYNKANLQLISIKRPDKNGEYSFMGLSPQLNTFIIAFDQNKQFNAVIQDSVEPK